MTQATAMFESFHSCGESLEKSQAAIAFAVVIVQKGSIHYIHLIEVN